MSQTSRVSLIMTVLNEGAALQPLLDSLLSQTHLPDELVVVDGGSRDDTVARLERYAQEAPFTVHLISAPGANISQGRNRAIAAASGQVIAVTDAGVRLDPDWLEALVAPFASDERPDVVSGFFLSAPQTIFERALGAVTLPRVEEIDPRTFHPSSRSVAFLRSAWESVGGYPEWLDYCEDLLFDFGLRDAGCRFAFAPEAVAHFRPRTSWRAYCRQYYRYARGDGKADFWRWRHALRYATYAALVASLVIALGGRPLWWLAVAAMLGLTIARAMQRLWAARNDVPRQERLRTMLWGPIIAWTGDVAKMLGYPAGVVWRWRHAPKEPWPKRQW